MIRRWLDGAFFLMGMSFTVLQALMVRELLVSFSGNELSIGFVLGSWLVLEALGSGLSGRFVERIPPRPSSYAGLQVALALLLPLSLLLALHVRTVVGAVPGEAVAALPAFLGSLLALAPLGLVDGAMFTAACRVRLRLDEEQAGALTGRVYVLEAIGSIVGGIAFTYLLLPLLPSTQILLLVASLNLAFAAVIFLASSPRQILGGLVVGLLAIAALILLTSPLGPALHQGIVASRWAPFQLAYEANSAYGNIAVLSGQGQITVFANGTPVLTAPDPDIAVGEQLVHLPALFLDELPQQALVIGGGAGGVLSELLRYPLQRVDYAELDPLLIQAVLAVPTALTTAELSDPRLNLSLEDGRLFVMERISKAGAVQAYDLIVINLPAPSTLVLNRLYTSEFLAMVRPLLAPRGLLVVPAPPARTYMGPAARDLLACYAQTLATAFPHVRAIPADDQTIWLASPEHPLDLDTGELVERWEVRGLETRVLQKDYLHYLLDAMVAAKFMAGIQEGPAVEVNRDGYPAGLRYTLAYESARLSPFLEPFFQVLGQLHWGYIALGIAILTLVGLFLVRRRETVVPVAIATTGLAGMTADLLIILAFQVLFGHVYQQVGLLITAFMAGLSVGGLAMSVWAGRLRRPWRTLALLEAVIPVVWAGMAGALALLLQRSTATFLDRVLLLAMNVVAGGLVGLEFPLANRILLEGGQEGSRVAGSLYAWDLVGATVGAVAVSAVLLPALGLVETALLVALLKAGSLLLVGIAAWRGGRTQT